MKLVRLLKMTLNQASTKVREDESFSWSVSYSESQETRNCLIVIAFVLCFRLYHREGL